MRILLIALLLTSCAPYMQERVDTTRRVPVNDTIFADFKEVEIKKGASLYGVARDANVSTSDLAAINHLDKNTPLEVGQMLKVPTLINQYKVAKGDTLFSISKRFNVSVARITELNDIRDSGISIGQTLKLTDKVYNPQSTATRNTPSYEGIFTAPLDKVRIIRKFGNRGDEISSEGITLAASVGTPVRAAAEGQVVFVAEDLKNFGNLVIIKHKDSWLTAYGYLDKIAVSRGKFIDRGQIIGSTGKSPNGNISGLHYAVRKGKAAVNPEKYTEF
jgi:murein DD-endopeptidase MepM/ murein hydrolase activator NlpD